MLRYDATLRRYDGGDGLTWPSASTRLHVIFTGVRYLHPSTPRGKWSLPGDLGGALTLAATR